MNTKKEKLLYATYQSFIDQCLGRIMPDSLNEILSEDAMGFGTTADEKIFGIEDFLKLIRIQKEQSEGLDMNWEINAVNRYVNSAENLAVFADDLHLTVAVNGEKIKMYVRISIVLEYTNNKWIVIHWHGSKPEDVQSEEDTFGIENWKQKVEKLEIIVAERTADLVEKNRELQIETSLERVRARSMAMHSTSELQAVIHTVHNELLHLNIAIDGGSFITINNDIDTNLRLWGSGGTADTSEEVQLPLYEKLFCTNLVNRIKNGPGFFTEEYTQKEKKEFFTFLFKHLPWSKLNAKQKKETLSSPGGYTRSCCVSKYTSIFIINHLGEKFSDADNGILKRFAKVFEQTYTRFLDLQKAEAQAKEAKIEAALEKIRSRSLAMHRSDELKDVIAIIFEKLNELNILLGTVAIWLFNKATKDSIFWVGNNLQQPTLINLPYDEKLMKEDTNYKDSWQAFLSGESYINKVYPEEKKNRYFRYVFAHNDLTAIPPEARDFITKGQKYTACLLVEKNSSLYFDCWQGAIYSEESIQVFRRVAKVFEQAYIRFLDLQKAEAQAREAKIEVALERVRSRTMAMQKSDELPEISSLLFQQVNELGLTAIQNSIGIVNEKTAFVELSTTIHGSHLLHTLNVPTDDPYVMAKAVSAWKAKRKSLTLEFEGKELKNYNELRNSFLEKKVNFPEDHWIVNISFFSKGWLSFSSDKNVSGEIIVVLKRFAAVFEQTYTRFLDLQKAEAQAREAQIELALERVRARTMAMQKSEELPETSYLLFQQLKELGASADQLSIGILNEAAQTMDLSVTLYGSQLQKTYTVKLDEPFVVSKSYAAWKANKKSIVITLTGKDLEDYNAYRNSLSKIKFNKTDADNKWVVNCAFFSKGWMSFSSLENVPAETIKLLERFTAVFDGTYTRFLDLQKAEAQAREAQIETALEKVRSHSMSMQKSEELKDVIKIVYQQLTHLKIKLDHAGFVVDYTAGGDWYFWIADEQDIPSKITHPYFESVWATQFNEAKEKGGDFFATNLNFEEKNKFYNELLSYVPRLPEASKDFYLSCPGFAASTVLFDNVSLYMENFSGIPYSDEENRILMRFGKVFQQTYTRFLDLQKAEAQAREAKIEAALEKIRSRSLAMHRSDELRDVIAIMFEKLNELNVLLGTVGIWLFNKATMDSFFWVGNDLQQPSMISLPYDAQLMEEDTNYRDSWQAWIRGEGYINKRYTSEQKNMYFNYVFANNNVDVIPAPVREIIMKAPVHIASLIVEKNSSLFFDSWQEQTYSEASINVFKKVSKVFEQAYIRFLDLQKAEAQAQKAELDLIEIKSARKKAEDALQLLQQTQKQLIQSEKMASLGELTAGIAHEIQNPLNFVNNFSEVSNELMDEMKDELSKGNYEDVNSIADVIKQNLEKINHHGKRAGDIVKGMLQHSKSSGGVKEPTDINALCDEYLRLSYHGLRAKDKSFNADFKTDFDESIDKINIIPQDIGRVLLNLYNNAFYACTERSRSAVNEKLKAQSSQLTANYQSTVSVTTKKLDNHVIITVSDNGNGIPTNIVDKIFQPFFTTKPTGQGTGLGLSLSYDIIKTHGGELKVETKEGEGSTFILSLPA